MRIQMNDNCRKASNLLLIVAGMTMAYWGVLAAQDAPLMQVWGTLLTGMGIFAFSLGAMAVGWIIGMHDFNSSGDVGLIAESYKNRRSS